MSPFLVDGYSSGSVKNAGIPVGLQDSIVDGRPQVSIPPRIGI